MPNFATDSGAAAAPPERTFRDSIAGAAYEEAGIGPEDLDLAEVYDLSTALELDWYENIGLCKRGRGRAAAQRRRHRRIGGRIPVNPSRRPGLLRRGHPGPGHRPGLRGHLAAARARPSGRQVEGATVGLTINQGLFGHGSSVIVEDDESRSAHARGLHRRRRPHPGRPPRRRPVAGPPRRPRRPLDQGARRAHRHRPRAPSTTSFFGCVDSHRPAGRRHRPHVLAGGRAPRGGARHHHRPPVRLVAAGRALRRAGGDERAPATSSSPAACRT